MKSRKATIIISVFVAVFIAIIATVGVFSIKEIDFEGFRSGGSLIKQSLKINSEINSTENEGTNEVDENYSNNSSDADTSVPKKEDNNPTKPIKSESNSNGLSIKLICPLEDKTYTITQCYNAEHPWLTLSAPKNSAIYAIAAGTVASAKYENAYGYCITIDHENGMQSKYSHAQSLNVEEGDVVSQGETIAFVGNTGNATGYCLGFCVLSNGNYVDPTKYISFQNLPKTENVHKHSFSAATCTKPATCSCGQTSGTVINHSWAEATCTTAKKCKLCGKIQGEALGHRFDCWNKSQCTRCYIDNPALPTPDSFTVVYESQTSTYNGCTVEIGDYYFSDLRDYLVGQAFFYINIKVIASGSTGAVKVEFYDENDCFLTYKTPSVYSGFGLTVGATEEVQCRIPEGAKKIIIKGM